MTFRRLFMLSGLLTLSALVVAAPTREELKRERQAIEADYARKAEACRSQFVVTPCLDKVRMEKQKALGKVVDQESSLDAQARRERADARERRVADKAQAARHAASAAPAPHMERPERRGPKPAAVRTPKASEPQDRHGREERKRAEFEARQQEIREHREEVERRNAERARRRPAVKPLPPPASAGL